MNQQDHSDPQDYVWHEENARQPVSLSRRGADGTHPALIIWLDDEQAMIRAGSRLLAEHFTDFHHPHHFHKRAE